ncbi:MAG: 6,7-dimethyl-8-ribityllumazine synthase [Candidatus Omnitrophota bacterium]
MRGNTKGKKFAIVVSRFNDFITKKLLAGCLDELYQHGVRKNDITVIWVPGAFEIPVVALRAAKKKTIHAVICLGAVIRGETMHFDLVARAAAEGIGQVSLLTNKPVIFGVLATDTVAQAYARSQERGSNKGRDAAQAAMEMAGLFAKI